MLKNFVKWIQLTKIRFLYFSLEFMLFVSERHEFESLFLKIEKNLFYSSKIFYKFFEKLKF